jgi:acetyl esterase/lipase
MLGISDGQRAVQLVRSRAASFGIDPKRIGIIGFSAGGMVAGAATVRLPAAERPAFVAMIYSSIPDAVPAGAPPAFFAAAADDQVIADVPQAFARWRASGAAAELHIYAKGRHGFAMRRQGLPVDGWLNVFDAWVKQQGFVPARAAN